MTFELLSEPIRRYIRDQRWESLRPIQAAAIEKILATEENYILSSRTASGKTEAAFLPILSKVDFSSPGVQVLYVSPLIALINDQFNRVEELCEYLDVAVTKWHGEANRSLKERLIKNPRGIVLITPESIEAMFVNAPYNVKSLFSSLKYVVLDEIHSFIGTDRGIQLKSLLSRLQQINKDRFTVVGLSATIGDFVEAKKMTGDPERTKVLVDRTAKETSVQFKYFDSEAPELPIELLKDLYRETRDHKSLIFPNSRGRAEEVAVKLKKISDKVKGHPYYFSHHSSVDKELREYVEHFAKNNQRHNFCISCTSTLELGIDIGSVDKVVQIDAAHSISSLIQRVGRSGRREGDSSSLLLYATDKWSLLQSLACWLLYKEGFIEPVYNSEKPYDILLHQALSIVKELSGCTKEILLKRLSSNGAFCRISLAEMVEIIDDLIRTDLLELLQNELIIGIEGEKVVNSRDFYSVFKSEPNLKVVSAGKTIGEIPFSPQIRTDENILLAARIWKIVDVDTQSNKIEVIPARDGKKPLFFGAGGIVHPRIREIMFQLLFETNGYPELDAASNEALQLLRKDFLGFKIADLFTERPAIIKEGKVVLFTFQGTRVNRSLSFLLKKAELHSTSDEHSSSFEIVTEEEISELTARLIANHDKLDAYLEDSMKENPSLLDFSKWGRYLPLQYQCKLLREKYFDFEEANGFLKNVRFVS